MEWRAAGGREKWPANRAPWIWVSLPVRVVDDFVRDLVVALTPMQLCVWEGWMWLVTRAS